MTHVPSPPSGPPSHHYSTQRLQAPSARRSKTWVAVVLAVLVALAAGFIAGANLKPQPTPTADIDCQRVLAAPSVSRLENGDVVALLQELDSADDVIAHIQNADQEFRFDAKNLYCLGEAAVPLRVLREMLAPSLTGGTPTPVVPTPVVPAKRKEPEGILLAEGTPITLRLQQEVNTKRISVGQSVAFEVIEPVQVQGVTLIRQGTPMYAEVTRAKKGRMFGQPAELEIQLTTVRAVDGQSLAFRQTASWTANDREDAAILIDDAGNRAVDELDENNEVERVPIGAFVRGKNVILPAGTTLTIYSPDSFRIQAKQS